MIMNGKATLPSESDIKKILLFDGNRLPSFPQVAAKLLELSRDENVSLTEIATIVETDPGISVSVLKLVNSAIYGLRRKITSLPEAVVLLGIDEIKKLSIGMTVFQKMFKSGKSKAFDRLLFWRHCLSVAVLSVEIAKEIGYPDPEEAYIAGLLHDIGKVFLDIQGRRDYGEFFREVSASSEQIIDEERRVIGLGHDDVGAFYCSAWNLPERLVLVVNCHHRRFDHLELPDNDALLVSIVGLADFICWTQGIGSFDIVRPPVLSPSVEHFIDIKAINVIECINRMNKEMDSISEFYNFVFPSSSQLQENLLWASLDLSRTSAKNYYREPADDAAAPEKTVETVIPFDLSLDLGKPLAKAKTLKEVLDIVMFQVGCIFQPVHWSLLLKDPRTGDMVFSVVVGTNKEKLQGVRLPKGEGIAGHIMETGEALIVEDVSKDSRFSRRVDEHTGFRTRSIIGTPLKTDNKTFGVIELINKISGHRFTSEELKVLVSIAEYAAIAIQRSYYNQALKKLATIDSLTGLKNRFSFEHALRNKEEMIARYGSDTSMLVIDINNFRNLYEAGGLQAADDFVKKLAEILKKTLRRADDIFRYGVEKFIVLLPRTDQVTAGRTKQRIMDAFFVATMNDNLPVQLSIVINSVKTDKAGELTAFIHSRTSNEGEPLGDGDEEPIEENLQPILEQEIEEESSDIDKKRAFRKKVSLPGEYRHLRSKVTGHIRVESVSQVAIGFQCLMPHRIKVNEFIDVQFNLDDQKNSMVERRAVVKEIKDRYIDAEFYNPPPYSANLGFYLMK